MCGDERHLINPKLDMCGRSCIHCIHFVDMILLRFIVFSLLTRAISVVGMVRCDSIARRPPQELPFWSRVACRAAVQAMLQSHMPPGKMTFRYPWVTARGGNNLVLPREYRPESAELHDLCAIRVDFPGRFQYAQGEFRDLVMAAESIINNCMYDTHSFPASGESRAFNGVVRIRTFLKADANLLGTDLGNVTLSTANGISSSLATVAKRFDS